MIRSYEVDAAQLCDALSVVPGVEHVALEFDGRGTGVLRVRLAAGADGNEVVSAAVAEALLPGHQPARVSVQDVELVTERVLVRATVRLRSGASVHAGSASAAATAAGGHRAVVCATARAVEHVTGGLVRLDVEAVDLVQVGPERVGVVVVTLIAGDRVDRLTGSALVREDRSDTLVRATLDALNRRTVLASPAG